MVLYSISADQKKKFSTIPAYYVLQQERHTDAAWVPITLGRILHLINQHDMQTHTQSTLGLRRHRDCIVFIDRLSQTTRNRRQKTELKPEQISTIIVKSRGLGNDWKKEILTWSVVNRAGQHR